MKALLALALTAGALTCAAQDIHFKVADAREEVPHFKHDYTTTTELRGHVTFTMEAETKPEFTCYPYPDMRECGYVAKRQYFVRLVQADGKDMHFSPTAVPENLIDRDLVPWVQSVSKEALRIDREFMKSNPAEFIAQDGWHWMRKAGGK